MSSPSVRLPFDENPVVATYLFTGFFFGILSGDALCDGLLNIYIQLSAPKVRKDTVNVIPLRFLPTIPPDGLGLLEVHDWTAEEMDRMTKPELVAAIIGALREEKYLYVHIDYFHLPDTEFYRRHHFRQAALVTGFDAVSGEFTVACYLRSGKFGVTRIPCLELAEAFYSALGRANSTLASQVNRLHSMKIPTVAGAGARLDLNAIKLQLIDYLGATNLAPWKMENRIIRSWSEVHDKSTPADTWYGTDVYGHLIQLLRSVDLSTLRHVDFRITRLLWEHKKMMSIRIRRLIARGAIADTGLLEPWLEVERLAWTFHFDLYRTVVKKEALDAAGVERALRDLEARERDILGRLCQALP